MNPPGAGLPPDVQVFAVGGAVRDALLGLPIQDRDWVVVGAQAQDLVAAGYQSVGQDFPVFLHPQTREEYALARTERKTAPGYRGFVFHADPQVRLEDDLARRDLTINAMAQAADGTLIDPFGGYQDLHNRILRHVGPAFVEDPVRILRVARFAARWPDFTIAPDTLDLMQSMVDRGEVDALVAERVWQEFARGLMAAKPSRMFEALRRCGALAVLLPELDRLWGVPQRAQHHPEVDTGVHAMMVLDDAARTGQPLDVRWAVLMHDLGKGNTPIEQWPSHQGHESRSVQLAAQVGRRLRVPAPLRALAELVAREHGLIHRAGALEPLTVLEVFERCDAIRRPERFARLLAACACDARGRLGFEHVAYPQAQRFTTALRAVCTVDAGAVARCVTNALAQSGAGAPAIAAQAVRDAVRTARLEALVVALAAPDSAPLEPTPAESHGSEGLVAPVPPSLEQARQGGRGQA